MRVVNQAESFCLHLFCKFLHLSVSLVLNSAQLIYLSTFYPYKGSPLRHLSPCLPVFSATSLAAQPPLLINLVLLYVLFPPCVWLSILQHLLSEISLSVRWCREQPSLSFFHSLFSLFALSPSPHRYVLTLLSVLYQSKHKHSLLCLSLSQRLPSVSISASPLLSWSVYDRELHIQA